MQAVLLALWELKRVVRSRRMLAILLGLPLAAAFMCSVLVGSGIRYAITITFCLFMCAMLTAALTYSRFVIDRISGLYDGLRCTPITDKALAGVRIVVGVVLFLVQAGILFGIIALFY
jgi:ABC-type transport system involved in cytochrome c biogenesis permease component